MFDFDLMQVSKLKIQRRAAAVVAPSITMFSCVMTPRIHFHRSGIYASPIDVIFYRHYY